MVKNMQQNVIGTVKYQNVKIFFIYEDFIFKDTDNSQISRIRQETILFIYYQFHLLRKIDIFICSYAKVFLIAAYESTRLLLE